MRIRWPWWLVRPRLGVVLGGGATLGAFEVGCIDVMARRGIVPDFLVGTSVGAINAAFWAHDPAPDAGSRLLDVWLQCDRSVMFPDGPVPMVGRLVQGRDHLTTQAGLERLVRRTIDSQTRIEDAGVPLAVVTTDASSGRRSVVRSGPAIPAILASAAIPGLWPAAQVAGRACYDGGLVSNCDVEAAVEAGMTDVLVVDVLDPSPRSESDDVWQVLERALAITARRQTELAVMVFGRAARIAVLRPSFAVRPRFGDFSRTRELFEEGKIAMAAFLEAHLGPKMSVRPGVFEAPTTRAAAVPVTAGAASPVAVATGRPA